jgi:2-polyprenyl-3-methyl-5-hydroxy-6-metoxy-1,4-benzoquinol methylase
MKILKDEKSFSDIQNNKILNTCSIEDIFDNYEQYVQSFHDLLNMPEGLKNNQIDNAYFHKNRYRRLLEIVKEGSNILDIGNDKPFLTWMMKKVSSSIDIVILSFKVEGNPYDTESIDIEKEKFGLGKEVFDLVIFAEVVEHLWRNPSNVFYEINQCLVDGGSLYVTTPNACELHAITNILWMTHPNQRGQYYKTLESGHLHLWTPNDLSTIISEHGIEVQHLCTPSPYEYTDLNNKVALLAKEVSPFFELMGEQIEIIAKKVEKIHEPIYPTSIYPDGIPVQAEGAITSFLKI